MTSHTTPGGADVMSSSPNGSLMVAKADEDYLELVKNMEEIANYFNAYATVPIVLLGLFGNILTMCIFWRQPSWNKHSIHYFFFLAVSDMGCLLIYGCVEWVSEGLKFASSGTFYFDLINLSAVSCKCFRFLWNVFGCVSAWLIVCVTTERYIGVLHVLKSSKILHASRRKKVIICVCLSAILFFTPLSVFVYDTKPIYDGSDTYLCTLHNAPWAWRVAAAYGKLMANYGLLVLIVMGLNFAIMGGLHMAASERRRLRIVSRDLRNETKVTKMLLIISTVFLITMIPAAVTWLTYFHIFMMDTSALSEREKQEKALLLAVGKFANTLSMVNYAVNFFIYSWHFDFYKSEVRRIFVCKKVKNFGTIYRKRHLYVVNGGSPFMSSHNSLSSNSSRRLSQISQNALRRY